MAVIAGKDRGKQGKILRALPKLGRVIVEGVNLLKRHQRPRRAGQKGEVVRVAMPIDASNVLLWCGRCRRGVRAGAKFADGKKLRICQRCGGDL